MESKLNFVVENEGKSPLLCDIFLADVDLGPIVIYCHGYKGFKDWGHMPLIPEKFAKRGMHFFKFNFSHNGGTMDNPIDFPDLEAFSDNNYSLEMNDLKRVIDYIFSINDQYPQIDLNRIYLLGHSRGGGIAILTASQDKRIKKLVTWSSVSDFARRFPSGKMLKKWKEKKVMYVENSRTKQKMPHKYQFYEDFIKNREKLDISEAEKDLTIPHLIIHGTKDESVYLGEALHLMSLNDKASLIKIENGTHTFGSHHPYDKEEAPHHVSLAMNYTLTFFEGQ